MKKLIILLAVCFALITAGTALSDGEVTVRVDGKTVYFDTKPVITDGRIMAPFRFIGEKIGASVFWYPEEKRVKLTKGERTVEFKVGESTISIDGRQEKMDVPVIMINGRTMIPIRFVAEALDGYVCWNEQSMTAEILTEHYSLAVGNLKIEIGYTTSDLSTNALSYNRIDKGLDRLDWYVFNKDYGEFAMAGVLDGKVVSMISACSDFTLTGSYENSDGVDYFTDENDKVYAVWVGKKYSDTSVIKENWESIQSEMNMQSRDFVNALRHSKGLLPLELDEALSNAAYMHSSDMAAKDYLAHNGSDGSTPWTRYSAVGGKNFACGENISGGWFSALENFDAWYNSEPHRNNMLNKNAEFIGHGFAYNADSVYKYYLTQMFSYKQ